MKSQAASGAVKRIVLSVPHAVTDNGVPQQLSLASEWSFLHHLVYVQREGPSSICTLFWVSQVLPWVF